MTSNRRPQTTLGHSPGILVIGLLVAAVAIAAILGYKSLASWPSTAASPLEVLRGSHLGTAGEADGVLPDSTTVFDDGTPAVANLDPALLDAVRRAATDASAYGIQFIVNSGWRSPQYQEQLLLEAVWRYGSKEEAARWVATADTSPHVAGQAIDLGPAAATDWLSAHGAAYGLCQIYSNEPWHYELRPEATVQGCPPKYTDPTEDPRMNAAPDGRRGTSADVVTPRAWGRR